jgi:hypothetical protein
MADKDFVMSLLGMKRLGLNQAQLLKIERVIDGQPMAEKPVLPYVPYKEAMEAIGFTTLEGVRKLAKQGHLELYKLPGRKIAIGVTRASLERCLQMREGAA